MKSIITIENIKCGGCMNSIRTKLNAMEGVNGVKISETTGEVSLDHDETWVDIIDKLNCALEYLMDFDHKVVVYPYPKNFITPSTGLNTYSRLNLKNRQNKTK